MDSSLLITGSRDGVCKVWTVDPTRHELQILYSFSPFDNVAVTALSFGSYSESSSEHLLAIGSELGDVQVWQLSAHADSQRQVATVPSDLAHGGAVKRLRWRPNTSQNNSNNNVYAFASCGEDHTLRVMELQL